MVFTLVVAFQMWWLYTGMLTRVKPLGKEHQHQAHCQLLSCLVVNPMKKLGDTFTADAGFIFIYSFTLTLELSGHHCA